MTNGNKEDKNIEESEILTFKEENIKKENQYY